MGSKAFTTRCFRNANWVPDPISLCAALQHADQSILLLMNSVYQILCSKKYLLFLNCIDGERSNKLSVTIAGSFLGALVAIVLMLLSVVGAVIFVKKGAQNHCLDPVH